MAARGSLSFCVVGNVVTSRRHDGTQFGNLGTERGSRNTAAGSARSATATHWGTLPPKSGNAETKAPCLFRGTKDQGRHSIVSLLQSLSLT